MCVVVRVRFPVLSLQKEREAIHFMLVYYCYTNFIANMVLYIKYHYNALVKYFLALAACLIFIHMPYSNKFH